MTDSYQALYFTGEGDQITFKGNYIHHTSGRSPKIDQGAFVHLPNNYWYANSGHAFEGADGYALVEGSVFQDVVEPITDWSGAMFAPTSDSGSCESALGRDCPANIFGSSGTLSESDTSVLNEFSGLEVADALDASSAQSSVPNNAGVGKT
jgi:pectin lyase